jgi:urea transport system ATP-binding protein
MVNLFENIPKSKTVLPKSEAVLYLEEVTVVFDGFKALDIQTFGVGREELRVIIGPNGAGKTTLCDVVSGKTRVATGRVFFNQIDITWMPEMDIARLGVGRKFQIPTVFGGLTVYENMELALPGRQGIGMCLWKRETLSERDRIRALLERVRLIEQESTLARNLSHGQRQWLEISMLIMSGPELLLVDEPAAGLTDEETALTAELLLELRGQHTIIVIEHDMDFVRQLDAKVTVLNEGMIMAEGSMEEMQSNPKVIEAYIGR